jgi:hypothetical protein
MTADNAMEPEAKLTFEQVMQLQELELRREYLAFEKQQFGLEFQLKQVAAIRDAGCASSVEYYSVLQAPAAASAAPAESAE